MRWPAIALAMLACVACERRLVPGAVRVHGHGARGELVVDGESRGPLLEEQVIELPPGEHRIALWRDGGEIVSSTVEVRSAMIVEVGIDPPGAPLPDPRLEPVAAPPIEPPEPLDPLPGPEPVPAPAAPATHPGQTSIASVLHGAQGELRACGQHVRDPIALSLQLTIHANGRAEVEVEGDAPPAVRRCVERTAARWRFPPGSEARITMPIRIAAAP